MEKVRRPWLRGAVLLGVLATFGAAALVSNAGAVAEKKEASKKFVRKQLNKLGDDVVHQPIYYRQSAPITVPNGNFNDGSVACPPGTSALGGGVAPELAGDAYWGGEVEASHPSTGTSLSAGTTGWSAGMEDVISSGPFDFRVYVICAVVEKDQNYAEGSAPARNGSR